MSFEVDSGMRIKLAVQVRNIYHGKDHSQEKNGGICRQDLLSSKYHLDMVTNQFLMVVCPKWKLSKLKKLIVKQFSKMYPEEDSLDIQYLRDERNLDLDDDFSIMDVFENNGIVQAIRFQAAQEKRQEKDIDSVSDFGKIFDDGGYRVGSVSSPKEIPTPPESDDESNEAPLPVQISSPQQNPPASEISIQTESEKPVISSSEESETEEEEDYVGNGVKKLTSIPSLKKIQIQKVPTNPSGIVRKKESEESVHLPKPKRFKTTVPKV